MFTDALLDVLNGGDPSYPPELSLNDIRDLTWEKLGTKSEEPVRPALYLRTNPKAILRRVLLCFQTLGTGVTLIHLRHRRFRLNHRQSLR